MILAQSLAAARARRTSRVLPDGRGIWVSPVFPASDEMPEAPMASFVEQLAHTIIPSHFHAVNQFQVLVEGQGTLGKRAVRPWTVHYTNAPVRREKRSVRMSKDHWMYRHPTSLWN